VVVVAGEAKSQEAPGARAAADGVAVLGLDRTAAAATALDDAKSEVGWDMPSEFQARNLPGAVFASQAAALPELARWAVLSEVGLSTVLASASALPALVAASATWVVLSATSKSAVPVALVAKKLQATAHQCWHPPVLTLLVQVKLQ